jgi:hypothetical protein
LFSNFGLIDFDRPSQSKSFYLPYVVQELRMPVRGSKSI